MGGGNGGELKIMAIHLMEGILATIKWPLMATQLSGYKVPELYFLIFDFLYYTNTSVCR